MRLIALLLALLVIPAVAAQDTLKKKTPQAKKHQAKKQLAHKKPTPEQIRKFNELQKKR